MHFEAYPFEKLDFLLKNSTTNKSKELMSLDIGEPKFKSANFIVNTLSNFAHLINKYPKSSGEEILLNAQIHFFFKRFNIKLSYDQILPTFGTREVLFNFPQFFLHDLNKPKVAFTNPFYQIYEGACIASRAKILHIDLLFENDFKPLINETLLREIDLVIINFPNNPTGSVLTLKELQVWVELALKYNFLLINDECYSEIYTNSPLPSLLEASVACGNSDFKNILVVNSISKRSSAPGLRSGFIAGDKSVLQAYKRYRTYIGCAVPLPLQQAAAVAWRDEKHVNLIRKIYQKNFKIAKEILSITPSMGTFYLWIKVKDDERFTKFLYENYSIKVLPGSYLGRNGVGKGYIRIALVYDEIKIKNCLIGIKNALKVFN